MQKVSLDLVRGTLDLLILKSLTWGPQHGYAVVSAIKNSTEGGGGGALPGSLPDGGQRLDRIGMGALQKQTAGEILSPDSGRTASVSV
jgi:hypothetical protein